MSNTAVAYYLGPPHDSSSEAELWTFAAEQGLHCVGVFSDPASFSSSLNRPGLMSAFRAAAENSAASLIILEPHALFSNATDAAYLVETVVNPRRQTIRIVRSNSIITSKTLTEHDFFDELTDDNVPQHIQTSKKVSRTNYLDILRTCQTELDPDLYLEIGVKYGKSIRLARKVAIGIDPEPRFKPGRDFPNVKVFATTSDQFFSGVKLPRELRRGSVDFAFIDGMHLFDFALRDFMNIEKYSHSRTVVAIDDVCPRNSLEAQPDWLVQDWAGDVYKLILCLIRHRPDLNVNVYNAHPTGIALISGLDPSNTILSENYDAILKEYSDIRYESFADFRDYVLRIQTADIPQVVSALDQCKRSIPKAECLGEPVSSRLVSEGGAEIPVLSRILAEPPLPDSTQIFRTLPLSISTYDAIFVRANGLSQALFLDREDGDILEASFMPRNGAAIDDPRVQLNVGQVIQIGNERIQFADRGRILNRNFKVIDEPVFLLGHLDRKYGHFLLESLSRAWALFLPDTPYKVLTWHSGDKFEDFHLEALHLLGLAPDRIIVGNQPMAFRQLVVPSRACYLFGSLSLEASRTWGHMRDAVEPKSGNRKTYLSRQGSSRRKLINESDVVGLFERLGFEIVAPELLNLTEQIRLVASSSVIAGCYGSQMHNSVFAYPGAKKVLIAPRNYIRPDELLISSICQCDTSVVLGTETTGDPRFAGSEWTVDLDLVESAVRDLLLSHSDTSQVSPLSFG